MRAAPWLCTLSVLLTLKWIDAVGSSLRGFVEMTLLREPLPLPTVILIHFRPWAILFALLFLGYALWIDRFPTFKSRAGSIFLLCYGLFTLSLGGLMVLGLRIPVLDYGLRPTAKLESSPSVPPNPPLSPRIIPPP